MKKYECVVCGWVYDPAEGDPDGGTEPGRPLRTSLRIGFCPVARATKEDLSQVEE